MHRGGNRRRNGDVAFEVVRDTMRARKTTSIVAIMQRLTHS